MQSATRITTRVAFAAFAAVVLATASPAWADTNDTPAPSAFSDPGRLLDTNTPGEPGTPADPGTGDGVVAPTPIDSQLASVAAIASSVQPADDAGAVDCVTTPACRIVGSARK